jgi:hypothetical protein
MQENMKWVCTPLAPVTGETFLWGVTFTSSLLFRLRQGASAALMKMPTPLPGLETQPDLMPLLSWSLDLLWSPRQRESDAGRWRHFRPCPSLQPNY